MEFSSVKLTAKSFWAIAKYVSLFNCTIGGIQLPGEIFLKGASYAIYSGVPQLYKASGTIIKIGRVDVFDHCVLVVCNRENCRMDWRVIRQKFIKCVDCVLNMLRASQTDVIYPFGCDEWYTHYIHKTKCTICNGTPIWLSGRDFQAFSSRIIEMMDCELDYLGYSCYMFVTSTEVIDLEALKASVSCLELQNALCCGLRVNEEVILEGKATLWNYEKVLKAYEQLGAVSKEAFPMFIGGHGVFCITATSSADRRMNEEDVSINAISFESDMLSDLVGAKVCNSHIGSIATRNTGSTRKQDLERLQQIIHWAKITEKFRHDLINAGKIASSVDIQMTTMQCNLIGTSDAVISAFYNQFRTYFGVKTLRNLSVYPFEDFVNHVDQTILPLIRTISEFCTNLLQSLNEPVLTLSSVPRIDQIETAWACELLSTFWLHGNLDALKGNTKSVEMITTLNLSKDTFRKMRVPFPGLSSWCPVVKFTREGALQYSGPYCLSQDVWFLLSQDIRREDVHRINQMFKSLKAALTDSDLTVTHLHEEVADVICKMIVLHSTRNLFQNKCCLGLSPQDIYSVINNGRLQIMFMNTAEYIESIFQHGALYVHLSVAHIVRELYTINKHPEVLKMVIYEHLEKTLLSSSATALLYPCSSLSSGTSCDAILLLPTCKLDDYSYFDLNSTKRARVMSHYKYAFATLNPNISVTYLTQRIERDLGSATKSTVSQMLASYVND